MNLNRHWAVKLVAAAAVAGMTFGIPARADDTPTPIVVVTSRDVAPYDSVVLGISRRLSDPNASYTVALHSLETGAQGAMQALRRTRMAGDAPILTIGSRATHAALKAPGRGPVIACMVVDSRKLRKAKNATGVLLDFPVATQLKWIRRFVPNGRTIGVLYNPAENGEQIAVAKRIASGLGLRLVAREVRRPQDLPAALDKLASEADLLWGVTDQLVLSRQTAERILLFSFRNRIPLSGLSASWVKAGALYALDRDYEDLGAQCGEMAKQILGGRNADTLPPTTPRKVIYALNLRTAEHLKLEFSTELIEGAEKVFR